jgi:hypothetical protein
LALSLNKINKIKPMKTKIILPLIAIIFLSSCADKFSLTKRKYTKGYYFASSKNNSSTKNQSEHKNLTVKNLAIKNSDLTVKPISNPEIISTTNNAPILVTNSQTKVNPTKHVELNVTASANSINNITTKAVIKPVANKNENNLNAQKKGSADTNLIILVILSLFPILALIAIYLKDGKTITMNFWIDLLLHFIFLYWLFALLVVLDVFSLA